MSNSHFVGLHLKLWRCALICGKTMERRHWLFAVAFYRGPGGRHWYYGVYQGVKGRLVLS